MEILYLNELEISFNIRFNALSTKTKAEYIPPLILHYNSIFSPCASKFLAVGLFSTWS